MLKLWEVRVLLGLSESYSPNTPPQPGGKFPKPRSMLSGRLRDQEGRDKFSFPFLDGLSRIQALKPKNGP